MKTKVIITVDTEFSIAGAFQDPENFKPIGLPAVLCEKNGHSHGLGFLLDVLNQYDLKATFFVEALNSNYFGYELMGNIAHHIIERGQDVQLHLHPCWQYFKNKNWKDQLELNPPNDNICTRTLQEIESILLEGIDVFCNWDLPRPIAIRTGSLCVNRNVYKAMASTGIKFSSNIGVGIFKPLEDELTLYSGCHEIESCYELPVLTYSDFNISRKKHLKLLTITGSNWEEIEYLLLDAAKTKMDYVVILTHPFEYIKNKNQQYNNISENRPNKKRLISLCEFLRKQIEIFSVTTFSELQSSKIITNNKANTLLEVPVYSAIKRMFENYANDKIDPL